MSGDNKYGVRTLSVDEHFIPIRVKDLLQLCSQQVSDSDDRFAKLGSLVQRYYHQHYFALLNDLKSSYQSLDPDSDLVDLVGMPGDGEETFLPRLRHLLEKGNFEQITHATLQQALREESLFNIRLEVNFDYFEEVLFFYRGEHNESVVISSLLGLKKRTLDYTRYDRVAVYVKFKDQQYFDEREIDASLFRPGTSLIKLFKNVPKADLDMLFPNAKVRMKNVDKVLIGGPALVGGGVLVATKLGGTLLLLIALVTFWLGLKEETVSIDQAALVTLAMGFGTLGGYLWKQFGKFKNRKIQFMQALSESLYFKNLDNNAGVFHYLTNMAEEEECKEVLLAYFVLRQQERVGSAEDLDKRAEQWLRSHAKIDVDFEIVDALEKLTQLGLVVESHDGFSAVSLDVAIEKMREQWYAFVG